MKFKEVENAINEIKSVRQLAEDKENEALNPLREFGVIGISLFTHDVQFSHFIEVEEFTNMKVKTQRYFDSNYSHEAYVEMGGVKYFALMTPSEYVEWKEGQDGSS